MTDDLRSPAQRVVAILDELDFPADQFFLGGSAGLALRDIRHIGDLDVGVPTALWLELQADLDADGDPTWTVWNTGSHDSNRCDPPYLVREVQGTEVHVFYAWRWRGKEETEFNDFNLVFRDGIELVQGWPCIRLQWLLRQKVDAVVNCYEGGYIRQKDITDIGLILEAMGPVATC